MHGAVERLVAVSEVSDVSASTPGQAPPTPAGFSVEVAVLNLGLPTSNGPKQKEEATMGDITYKNTHMRKPCQLLFFVQNILSKILGRVVLRRQLVEKLYFSKFRRELCLDANSASGHPEYPPPHAHGANRRHQRVPPSTPQDLRRRGAEGAARRNVLRLPWQKRALLATASARDRDRRGRAVRGGQA